MNGANATDLRRAPLTDLRPIHFRSGSRDLWADEAALYDRLLATWAGLDDAAWHLPGAAPSDGGGPDWSLAEHIGHIAEWLGLAAAYTAHAAATGAWPADSDYEDGDFDRWNEAHRAPWTTMARNDILDRLDSARLAMLAEAHQLPDDRIRADEPWGWVYMALHGHYLDHLGIIETWADTLRVRQADGDPFVDDPRPVDHAGLLAQDALVMADFDRLVRPIPADRWDAEALTPRWTLRDHVAHLGDWAEEGIRAIDVFARLGLWPSDPDEGIDAWNERMVVRTRGSSKDATLARFDTLRADLVVAIATLSVEDLRSADGWAWTYDCLHGHIRKHLALIGPWCVAQAWPDASD